MELKDLKLELKRVKELEAVLTKKQKARLADAAKVVES